MSLVSRFQNELRRPQSILEKEQFQKIMLDCVEPGVGYIVFLLIGCAALYGHVPTLWLVISVLLIVIESIVKISGVGIFKNQNAQERSDPRWRLVVWLGGLYTGCFFGLASLVLLLPLPHANHIVLAFAFLGVYITSCWLGSSYLSLAVVNLVPLALPLALAFAWVGTPMYLLISLALLFMTAMSLFYVKSMVRQHSDLVYAKQRIEEVSENLDREKQAAEKLVVDKNRFIASASHDLRQPLHALGLFHSTIRARSTDQKVLAVLDSVDRSTFALNNLFENLLDVSRLDSGVIKPVFESFCVDSLFASIHDEFHQMAEAKGLQLIVKYDSCIAYSDVSLVEQILRNLLGNAIKFTESGTVTLSADGVAERVEISVSDTGPGIPKEDTESIYNEFHQAERSKHDTERGFGLGLAIVRRVSALLDAPLKLSAVAPTGACFSLEIPLSTEIPARQPVMPQPADDAGLDARILVIDDNVNILDGMQTLLLDWNVECLTASSRDEALQCLQEAEFVPELLICDYHLAFGDDGLSAANSVFDHVGHAVPTIVITGDSAIDFSDLGDVDLEVLFKPVHATALREAIVRSLGRRARADATEHLFPTTA